MAPTPMPTFHIAPPAPIAIPAPVAVAAPAALPINFSKQDLVKMLLEKLENSE